MSKHILSEFQKLDHIWTCKDVKMFWQEVMERYWRCIVWIFALVNLIEGYFIPDKLINIDLIFLKLMHNGACIYSLSVKIKSQWKYIIIQADNTIILKCSSNHWLLIAWCYLSLQCVIIILWYLRIKQINLLIICFKK